MKKRIMVMLLMFVVTVSFSSCFVDRPHHYDNDDYGHHRDHDRDDHDHDHDR